MSDTENSQDAEELSSAQPPAEETAAAQSSTEQPSEEQSSSWDRPAVERQSAGARLVDLDEIEVRVAKLVEGGDGLARFEGIPIFVPLSAPGDRLRVRLTERRPGFGRAAIVEILEPGPGRRDAPCPHYATCGGCNLQHLEESKQLQYKVLAVRETLRRLGGIDAPPKVKIIPGDSWGYRLRAQLHLADTERGRQAGYYARGSHDLVPVEQCPILVPELEAALPTLPRRLRDVKHGRLDITAGDDKAWTSSPPVDGLPQGTVSTRVGDFVYSYDARCFFQAHRQLTPSLVEHAVGEASDTKGTAYDLFSGVGLFSLPLARRYGRVVSVEGDRVASRLARKNARANGLKNITVEPQSVDSFVKLLAPDAARVIVDPPRLGLTFEVRKALVEKRPRHLTYVSCDAATLARDLKQIRSTFELESLTLLDMFPQTGHMETVAQLKLKDA